MDLFRSRHSDSSTRPAERAVRLSDRHETGVALLVAVWTGAFLVRSRLTQSARLGDLANEALLSLLFVVPIMLLGWAALALIDRRR